MEWSRGSWSACGEQSKQADRWTVPATRGRDKRIGGPACYSWFCHKSNVLRATEWGRHKQSRKQKNSLNGNNLSLEKQVLSKSTSGSHQQVLVLSVRLLLLRERRSLLLTRRHLAGLVQDDKEDEDEEADHRVANDGHDGPHGQAHPQLMFHGFSAVSAAARLIRFH